MIEAGREILNNSCLYCGCKNVEIKIAKIDNKENLIEFNILNYKDINGYIYSILYKMN